MTSKRARVSRWAREATLLGLLPFCASAHAEQLPRPGVRIFAMGGTIAGSAQSSTDTTTYKAGALGVTALIDAVPELKRIANVQGEQIANLPSFDITQAVALKLAKAINLRLQDPETQGVVVTHGTDTLEETAFLLDLTVQSDKPVVVVGAMRPATAISSDGAMNLLEAVTLATVPESRERGVMVVLNDRIGSAFYVTKTNTTATDAFRAPEQGNLGVFVGGAPRFYFSPARPLGKPFFDVTQIEALPKVVILYSHQDQDSALLEAAVNAGAKGIVLAGTGNGSLPTDVAKNVAELMARGIPIVRSSRTGAGFVTTKQEGIAAGQLNPQKARILLSLALASGASLEQLRTYFGS